MFQTLLLKMSPNSTSTKVTWASTTFWEPSKALSNHGTPELSSPTLQGHASSPHFSEGLQAHAFLDFTQFSETSVRYPYSCGRKVSGMNNELAFIVLSPLSLSLLLQMTQQFFYRETMQQSHCLSFMHSSIPLTNILKTCPMFRAKVDLLRWVRSVPTNEVL